MPEQTDGTCERCKEEIETAFSKWEATDLMVCTECWFRELSGEERREYAENATKRRNARVDG